MPGKQDLGELYKCPVCRNYGFRIYWKYRDAESKEWCGKCANCGQVVIMGVG